MTTLSTILSNTTPSHPADCFVAFRDRGLVWTIVKRFFMLDGALAVVTGHATYRGKVVSQTIRVEGDCPMLRAWSAPVVTEVEHRPEPTKPTKARKAKAPTRRTVTTLRDRMGKLQDQVFKVGCEALADRDATFSTCLAACPADLATQYRALCDEIDELERAAVSSGRAWRGTFGQVVWNR